MAQPTAQYEALQYSSQRKDQDFGDFAMDLAEQEKERQALEYKRKREEEKFQMDMINDNPDVVFASFENSGLENVDSYNAKVSELVKGRFNELNAQYNKDGDRMKYFTSVAKLTGEVRGYTTNVNNIIKYGQDIVAKGDEVSASTLYRSQQLNSMFKGGAPTMGADGSLGNISMTVGEDGKPTSEAFNWGKASSLISVKGRSDMHAVATESVKTFGDPSKFIVPEGKTVLSSLLERDGSMNEAGLRLIEDNTRALSDEDLIDTADQMGLTVNFDRKDITKFDRERIVKEVAKQESEYAIDLLKMQEKENDVDFKKLEQTDSKLALSWKNYNSSVKEGIPYTAALIDESVAGYNPEEGPRVEYYMKRGQEAELPAAQKLFRDFATQGEGPLIMDGAENVKILSYKENNKFGDQAHLSYTYKEEYTDPVTQQIKTRDRTVTEFVQLPGIELANAIRTKMGLNPRSADPETFYGNIKKKSAY